MVKKRLICVFMTLVLLLSAVPGVAPDAHAASELKTSDHLVNLLKKFEGFTPVCIKDGTQRSVGYGTRCDSCNTSDPNYPNVACTAYTAEHPITEAHATQLMRNFLTYYEDQINVFANRHGLTFTQQQFDALVSFSYNCGAGWTSGYGASGTRELNNPYALHNALIAGDQARVAYAMTTWKTFRNRVASKAHIHRRMLELQVYFDGIYGVDMVYKYDRWPENARYVHLYGNGGVVQYAIHGFHVNTPSDIYVNFISKPTGYDFVGWFTEREGGQQVTKLTNAIANGTALYAHWRNAAGDYYVGGDDQVENVAGVWYNITENVLNVRVSPSTSSQVVYTLSKGARVKVTETQTGADNRIWGKMTDGHWICIFGGGTYNAKAEDAGGVEATRYTVEFKDYDGSIISSTMYLAGAEVKAPTNPVREMDNKGEYEFIGWDKTVTKCTGNTVYTAQYKLKYVIGDINRDSVVNEDDAIYLLRSVIFPEKYMVYYKPDFDSNGNIDEDDAIHLLRHVVFPDKYTLRVL